MLCWGEKPSVFLIYINTDKETYILQQFYSESEAFWQNDSTVLFEHFHLFLILTAAILTGSGKTGKRKAQTAKSMSLQIDQH